MMNIIKCTSIVKVIKNFRKSITYNVDITEITACLDELLWTLNNKRVLFTTKDVLIYLLQTLFIVKNVVEKNSFFNVQDNLHKTMCQLVSILIDSVLLLTLNNISNECEIASLISMIIEYYVYGFQNTLTVFRNLEHLSDQLMATNHQNILDILKQRFPQCFENPETDVIQDENFSDDLNRNFSDELNFTSYEILTSDELNDQQSTVLEFNMSCDELIMYMDAPYDDNTDIPWLNSFQIRTKSKMTKKQKTIEFQDNNLVVRNRHTLNCAPCYVDLTNINERQTRNLLKRRNTIDCSKTFKAQFNDVNENIQSFSVHGKPKRKCRRNPIYYCWECHLIIKIKTQYCCLSCSRLYHKICFTFNDLVCLDCYMSKRMKNQDPESLALTLGATMDKVLKSQSASTLSCLQSYYLGKNKLINLKSISQKVDSKTYTCFFDFLSDIKMILHKCCIKPNLSHLKKDAKIVMEMVLKDLRSIITSTA